MRAKLRSIREGQGYSQATFSEKIGISRNHYCQIETGEKNPSLPVAIRIKRELGYARDDLFENKR